MSLLIKDYWFRASPIQALESLKFLAGSESRKEFLEIIMETDDLKDYFISYAWILREESELAILLNQTDLPLTFLLNFIYHGLGDYIKSGNTDYIIYFSRIAKHISAEQSLRLLLDDGLMSKDPALKIQLLANLDAKSWEIFFNKIDEENFGIQSLTQMFKDIPEEDLRRVFYRNTTLYGYMRMILVLSDSESQEVSNFLKSVEEILNGISVWEVFAKDMKSSFPTEIEKLKKPNERNPNRLSILMHEILKTPETERANAMDFLLINEAILDENEFNILNHAINHFSEGELVLW